LQAQVGAVVAAQIVASDPAQCEALTSSILDWLAAADSAERAVIPLGDPLYPPQLLESPDPPLLLYAQGRLDLLSADSIAIVGSRSPTAQGREHAHRFAAELSRHGLTVVSGLALGIDAQAHLGALEGAGSTIAVTGTGLDRVYPARHRELARRISGQGVLLSEYALGMPPLPHNFPQRNRIIAGLSRGTLVVEAALQSGSLISARLASEAGREVFAIPGSIHSPQSRGCHGLIKQGAKLVETAQDVLEELGMQPARSPAGVPAPQVLAEDPPGELLGDDDVVRALGFDPVSLDALVSRTGIAPARLQARMLELELAGQLARLPGGLFQRIAAG
jgi:DNA processing protein